MRTLSEGKPPPSSGGGFFMSCTTNLVGGSVEPMKQEVTLEQLTVKTFKQVLAIPDPEVRVSALTVFLDKLDGASELARRERLKIATDLRQQGVTWARLHELTGLSVTYLQRRVPVEIELRRAS